MTAGNTSLKNLADSWRSAVQDGLIANEVEAVVADPGHRWKAGDRLRFGVRLQNGSPEYFATNLNTCQLIKADVEERPVQGTDFICQFNGYRALRPGGPRSHVGRQPEISAAPSDCRFYCQYPDRPLSLLARRPLTELSLRHWHWNIYYNAFPFDVAGHFLCVPAFTNDTDSILRHLPQKLTAEFLEDLSSLIVRDSPALVFFFSALHAGASVNHIHVQAIFHGRQLPLERARCVSYKGFSCLTDYVAEAFVFNVRQSLEFLQTSVERLEQQGIPFNLVLIGEQAFVFPRNAENEVVDEFPGSVLAGPDLAGKIITTDRASYERADRKHLQNAFSKACISARKVIDGW